MSKTLKDRPYSVRRAELDKKLGDSYCAACETRVTRQPDDISALFYADDHRSIAHFVQLAEKFKRSAVARELNGYLFRRALDELERPRYLREPKLLTEGRRLDLIDDRRILLSSLPKGSDYDKSTLLFGEGDIIVGKSHPNFNVFVEITAIASPVEVKPFHWHGWAATRLDYGRCHCSSCLGENRTHADRRHERSVLHNAVRSFNNGGMESIEEMDFV